MGHSPDCAPEANGLHSPPEYRAPRGRVPARSMARPSVPSSRSSRSGRVPRPPGALALALGVGLVSGGRACLVAQRQPEAWAPAARSRSRRASVWSSRQRIDDCASARHASRALGPDQPRGQPRRAGDAGREGRADRGLRADVAFYERFVGGSDEPRRAVGALGRVRAPAGRHLAVPGRADAEPQSRRA